MVILPYALAVLAGYFLGSIPTGFLVAKARGLDIRTVGSGNIGATNVFRSLGKPAGIFVLLVDGLKGWVAAFLVARLLAGAFGLPAGSTEAEWVAICGGLAAILGHNYTCWLHFKGGKGIATSAGVLAALVWPTLLIILAIWIVVFSFSRYVSLASITASIALPLAAWRTNESRSMICVTGAMAALAIYKHKANIRRLLNGTENRIGQRPASSPSQP